MGVPAAFDSDRVRLDSECLNLRDKGYLRAGELDPRDTAVDALPGSLYMSSSVPALFIKNDSGETTNWRLVSDFSAEAALTTAVNLTTTVLTRFVDCEVNLINNGLTITLHSAALQMGQEVAIRKSDVVYDIPVTVTDGTSTWYIYTVGETIRLISTGLAWRLISRYIPSVVTTWFPTWAKSAGTQPAVGNGVLSGLWSRDRQYLHGDVSLLMGSTTTFGDTNGGYTFTIPTGILIDTTKLPTTTSEMLLGESRLLDSLSDRGLGQVYFHSTTAVRLDFNKSTGAAAYVSSNFSIQSAAPWTWAANDRIMFRFKVPIAGWEG